MILGLLACLALGGLQMSAAAPTSGLVVQAPVNRSSDAISEKVESAVRQLAMNTAALSRSSREALRRRGLFNSKIPFSLPVKVTIAGLPEGASRGTRERGIGDITLQFDASGSRTFPTAYQQLLQDTFNIAKATIGIVFGAPSEGGIVHVRNFDADIADRDAVVGGYYVHNNGSGEREIRFPVYNSPEAAAVNFVHTLLLAYLGASDYGYDAFTEGIVRAGVLRIVRTAGAMPATLDAEMLESVLDNTYDVRGFYDWFNQRALGGERFVAQNLRDVPLPVGGSLGGIYLARYQMAGSAWQKVLVQYPGFISAMNQALYTNPSLRGDVDALTAQAQTVIDTLGGSSGATVEGRSFAEWFRRQHVLDTHRILGQKLFVQPIPIPAEGGSSDFGVFLIQATYYQTMANGDEILLAGTSYPIFWTPNFDRIFPSAQEDSMPIAGAYGAVAPNLPSLFGSQPYRCAVDIPIVDKINRTYVPAGAVSTGANPTEKNFYGTVLGVNSAGATVRVRLTIGATVFDNINVTNGAFGTLINQPIFTSSARVRVEVIRNAGIDTVVIDRLVNKGPGPLALDLRPNDGEFVFSPNSGLSKGMSLLGLPIDPIAHTAGELFGVAENSVLLARYNAAKAGFDIYPNTGMPEAGDGFFVRLESANPTWSYLGKDHPGTPVAVALRPGWNLITAPVRETVPTSSITVVTGADFPKSYADALGVELGTTFFQFSPGAPDAATGAPETGTLDEATQFEPGKGYYIRVLVPAGAVLLFEPNSIAGRPRAAGFQATGETASPAPDWRLRLRLVDGDRYSTTYVGQSKTATLGYDRREDSGLPLGVGGLQISVQNTEPMFQDMRRSLEATVFKVVASGLQKGKLYSLQMKFMNGQPNFTFTDPEIGAGGRISREWTYTFRASGKTRMFEIIKRRGER